MTDEEAGHAEAPRRATVATNLSLKPPGPFNFRRPDEWPKWKRRFNQYLAATGLDRAEDSRTVSMLLYCMGEDAEDVLTSTNIKAEEREVYATVITKLDDFFKVRRNIIFERAKFNRRDQAEGESAEQYITCLYSLVEDCDYGALKDDLLRDRIVVGIWDKTLSEKLQMDATLTLEKAKLQVRQKEAIQEQGQELLTCTSSSAAVNVEGVKHSRRKPFGRGNSPWQPRKGGASGPQRVSRPCIRCGKARHSSPDKCPALVSVCKKCGNKGHYTSQCLSKKVAATEGVAADTEADSSSEDNSFLGAVGTDKNTVWMAKVQLQGKPVEFKLDTGAEETVISEKVYHTLRDVKLGKSSRRLYGPAHQPLGVVGQFTGTLKRGRRKHSERRSMLSKVSTTIC